MVTCKPPVALFLFVLFFSFLSMEIERAKSVELPVFFF